MSDPDLKMSLGRSDAIARATGPILRHMLGAADTALFSDRIIATIRAMTNDLSRQLLLALARDSMELDYGSLAEDHEDTLANALLDDDALLAHIHALALEGVLTEKLQERSAIDAVLTPMVQELLSKDEETNPGQSAAAMHVLVAQARFMQAQRRMDVPLAELPGDLLHGVLLRFSTHCGELGEVVEKTSAQLRVQYDEGNRRAAQITRLLMTQGSEPEAALVLDRAGVAIFATALAMASGQDRDQAIVALAQSDPAHLTLMLRAAGVQEDALFKQITSVHQGASMSDNLAALSPDAAAKILDSDFDEGGV